MVGWKLLGGKLSVEDGSSQYGNGFYFGEKPMELVLGFFGFFIRRDDRFRIKRLWLRKEEMGLDYCRTAGETALFSFDCGEA
jgi:hypothetical protein